MRTKLGCVVVGERPEKGARAAAAAATRAVEYRIYGGRARK